MNEAIDTIDKPSPRKSDTIKRKKENNVQSTIRQERFAGLRYRALVENIAKSDKELMLEAGYDLSTAIHPSMIMKTKGYIQAFNRLSRASGLTEELIKSSLVEDIEKKPQRRVRELELGADILSMRKRPIETNNTLNIALFSTEQQERIAQRILESIGNKPPNTDSSQKHTDTAIERVV